MPQRKQNKKTKNNKGRGGRTTMPLTRNPRNIRSWQETIVGPEEDKKFAMTFLFTLNGATTTIVRRYNPNVPYQPEVSGATNTVPGYSEYAALFGFYRVIKYRYKATMSNLEAFPVAVYALNSNNDPTTTAALVVSNNALCQNGFLAAKGGGKDTLIFTKEVEVAHLLGSGAVEDADSYRSLINAAPADITWLGFGAQSGTGANITLGVVVMLELTMYVRLYDRLLQV